MQGKVRLLCSQSKERQCVVSERMKLQIHRVSLMKKSNHPRKTFVLHTWNCLLFIWPNNFYHVTCKRVQMISKSGFPKGLKKGKTSYIHVFLSKSIVIPFNIKWLFFQLRNKGGREKPTVKKPLSAPCACQCSVCRRQPALPPGPLCFCVCM